MARRWTIWRTLSWATPVRATQIFCIPSLSISSTTLMCIQVIVVQLWHLRIEQLEQEDDSSSNSLAKALPRLLIQDPQVNYSCPPSSHYTLNSSIIYEMNHKLSNNLALSRSYAKLTRKIVFSLIVWRNCFRIWSMKWKKKRPLMKNVRAKSWIINI